MMFEVRTQMCNTVSTDWAGPPAQPSRQPTCSTERWGNNNEREVPRNDNTYTTTLHAVKECKFPKIMKSDWNRCGWGGKGEGVEMWRDKTNRVGPIKMLQDSHAHNANGLIPPAPCSYLPTLFRSWPPACKCNGSLLTQCLAQHNVGQEAEGVAFDEENSHTRAAVVEGHILNCNVLHGVLHPQVHENGFKKKNEREVITHSLPLKGVKQWPLIRTWLCTADSFLQDLVHRIARLTDLMWGCGSYRPE